MRKAVQVSMGKESSKVSVAASDGCKRDGKGRPPRVLALEGSSIGHNVARRRLVGELHAPHLLDACHKLTCIQSPPFGMQPKTKTTCIEAPACLPRRLDGDFMGPYRGQASCCWGKRGITPQLGA